MSRRPIARPSRPGSADVRTRITRRPYAGSDNAPGFEGEASMRSIGNAVSGCGAGVGHTQAGVPCPARGRSRPRLPPPADATTRTAGSERAAPFKRKCLLCRRIMNAPARTAPSRSAPRRPRRPRRPGPWMLMEPAPTRAAGPSPRPSRGRGTVWPTSPARWPKGRPGASSVHREAILLRSGQQSWLGEGTGGAGAGATTSTPRRAVARHAPGRSRPHGPSSASPDVHHAPASPFTPIEEHRHVAP